MADKHHWTLDDIPWSDIRHAQVDHDIASVVKCAGLVERNAADYVAYLKNVFADDEEFKQVVKVWGEEEIQHGEALGRWASAVDPAFDFEAAFSRFVEGYRIPVDAVASVRGSRSRELVARCIVETGTSAFYSAMRDATAEPVLKLICHQIAGDEFRHYKMFYDHMQRYLSIDRPSTAKRAFTAFARGGEVVDDELAYAYYAANMCPQPYNRAHARRDLARKVAKIYRRPHIERATSMTFKAAGLKTQGLVRDLAAQAAWRMVQWQVRKEQAA